MADDRPNEQCERCGGTDFQLLDGLYYCTICQSQSQHMREVTTAEETGEVNPLNFALRIADGGKKTKKLVEPRQKTLNPSIFYEMYTVLLRLQTESLKKLGICHEIENAVFKIWTDYLNYQKVAFLNPGEENFPETKKVRKSEISAEFDEKIQPEIIRLTSLKLSITIAICYLGLIKCGANVYFSTFLQLVINGVIPYHDAYEMLPDRFHHPILESHLCKHPLSCNIGRHYFCCMALAKCIKFDKLVPVDFHEMAAKVLLNLNLPGALLPRVNFLYDQIKEGVGQLYYLEPYVDRHYVNMVPPELKVLVLILITLKLTFGLDDRSEFILSEAASANKNENSFVWTNWLAQLKLKTAVLMGEPIEEILKPSWFDRNDLTINKITRSPGRYRRIKRKLTHKDLKDVFVLPPEDEKSWKFSMFPLRKCLDSLEFDEKRSKIMKRDFFRDSLDFLNDLPKNFDQSRKIVENLKQFSPEPKEILDFLDDRKFNNFLPYCHFYQVYNAVKYRKSIFGLASFEDIREKEFSKSFDVLLTLFCWIYNDQPQNFYHLMKVFEEMLFCKKTERYCPETNDLIIISSDESLDCLDSDSE